jgi:hypothetical protein
MSKVARLAGALLAETHGSYYLVGNTKRPCDFAAHGFGSPGVIDAMVRPIVPLEAARAIALEPPWIVLDVEGDALPALLAERLLVTRNASVSDRLWRMLLGQTDEDVEVGDEVDARWFGALPKHVWDAVRDSVLRCL